VVTDEADGAEPVSTQNDAMRKQLDRYLRHINIHTVVTAVSVGEDSWLCYIMQHDANANRLRSIV
jgi:hypothetical protein